MIPLSGPCFGPIRGTTPRFLVMLLHGIGADGHDLIHLAPYFAQILPEGEFFSPHAPFPYGMGSIGYQWFALHDHTPAMMLSGIRTAAPILDHTIDHALTTRQLSDDQLVIIGFSQGTMMALHVMPRREKPCAAIVGFSGVLLDNDVPSTAIRSRPPTLLIHGEDDMVVPFQALKLSESYLMAAGFDVTTCRCPGLGHSIDDIGLQAAKHFLMQKLNL